MKAVTGADISVGGPDLAAQTIAADLVDEYHLFLTPVVVGGGKQSLPNDVRLRLELLDELRQRRCLPQLPQQVVKELRR